MIEHFTEQELILAFRTGGAKMESAIRYLHREAAWRTAARVIVKKTGGDATDAEMVLHDGLLILAMNVQNGKFNGKSTLKTYFSGICRNIWLSMLKKKVQTAHTDIKSMTIEATTISVETDFMKNEQQDILREVIDTLGSDCKMVLGLWALDYSYKEIAEKMGISEGAARKRKYDCLKKLTKLLKDRPWLVDEILND